MRLRSPRHLSSSAVQITSTIILAIFLPAHPARAQAQSNDVRTQAALKAFARYEPIDTHAHVQQTNPHFSEMLDRLHLHLLDIILFDDKNPTEPSLDQQRADALHFVNSNRAHAAFCTSFNPFDFSQPDFTASTIAQLNQDFANGAVAVKIWKNIGMELKDASGRYVLADDPKFQPIYRDMAAHGKTLIAHQAEPDVAWGTPDPHQLDASYYAGHPEWNMTKIPGAPSKATVLAARNHLLAMNPDLHVVGAHFGSAENDVALVAQQLDRYPNFAVDTAARVRHLTVQPTDKVRQFLIKYQDRILYGTDLSLAPHDDAQHAIATWEAQYALDWRFFSTSDHFEYQGRPTQGLNLPPTVLKKIFHDNATRWIPGILASSAN